MYRNVNFYYYSVRASGPYVPTDSGLRQREFDDLQVYGWCRLPTVAAVWACEAAPLKTAGKHPAKSVEAERGALVGRGSGLEKKGELLIPAL